MKTGLNKFCLAAIPQALTQPAELRDRHTEVMLYLLEAIYPNPKLLHHLQEQLSQPPELLSPDPKAFALPFYQITR